MEWNHCSHLGIPINKILACFDPVATEQVTAQSDQRFGKRCRKLIFKTAAHLAILGLLGALMLIIKFQFNWIIEEMSKI